MLPHDFLVWQTVYGYFRHWRITKTWQEINAKLQQWYRVSEGREATQDVLTVNQLKLLVG
jgi:putative transposase